MGWAPQVAVPDNVKAAVKNPSRYEPVLNETYADLLEHYGIEGLPARVNRPRDKALVENGVLIFERRVLVPLNRAIADRVRELNGKPYSDGTARPASAGLARQSSWQSR